MDNCYDDPRPRSAHPCGRRLPAMFGLALAIALAATPPAAARSGTHPPCPTAQTTTATAKCEHCNAFKTLIVLVKDGRARLETHEVAHGVLIQATASREDAVPAVHEAMGQISSVATACGTPGAPVQVCDLCRARMVHLAKASQDWAKTSTGATLMLTSEDPELVRWLREDGHAQQALVDRVASR